MHRRRYMQVHKFKFAIFHRGRWQATKLDPEENLHVTYPPWLCPACCIINSIRRPNKKPPPSLLISPFARRAAIRGCFPSDSPTYPFAMYPIPSSSSLYTYTYTSIYIYICIYIHKLRRYVAGMCTIECTSSTVCTIRIHLHTSACYDN